MVVNKNLRDALLKAVNEPSNNEMEITMLTAVQRPKSNPQNANGAMRFKNVEIRRNNSKIKRKIITTTSPNLAKK